jgi:hypothetical protein
MVIMLSNGQRSATLEMIGYAYEFYLKKATIDMSATPLPSCLPFMAISQTHIFPLR